jgi:hypothetical protein
LKDYVPRLVPALQEVLRQVGAFRKREALSRAYHDTLKRAKDTGALCVVVDENGKPIKWKP